MMFELFETVICISFLTFNLLVKVRALFVHPFLEQLPEVFQILFVLRCLYFFINFVELARESKLCAVLEIFQVDGFTADDVEGFHESLHTFPHVGDRLSQLLG